jgi:hypothetical protein
MRNEVLKNLLGMLATFLALGMGWGFWIYFINGVVIVVPFMLGYVYICINIAKFKKWAWQSILCIIIAALIMELLFIFLGGVEEGLFEWFFILIVFTSSIVMTVFGISVLIRKLCTKINKNENKT